VELRKGDDSAALKKAGITLFQKTKTKLAFSQPCACFDGKLCGIYHDRPARCRAFECGLLKKVAAGDLAASAALKKIREAKKRAATVRELLRDSGQHDERMALTHRYSEVMCSPIDFADEGSAERRGELMLAVAELMQMLEQDFLR